MISMWKNTLPQDTTHGISACVLFQIATLFNAIKDGRASVVTDHIDQFTKDGIKTKSGELIEADIIVQQQE
jgi:cation diffusion facilitator CzcD-associated flavoprotein CzcO